MNSENLELVLGVLELVPEDGYEDDPSPLLFNYTNIYILPLTIIFFTTLCNLAIFKKTTILYIYLK
jgi:hypothetical protein